MTQTHLKKITQLFFFALTAMVFAGCASFQDGSSTKKSGYYLNDGPVDDVTEAKVDEIPLVVPKREKLSKGAKKQYLVFGKTYSPMQDLIPYSEIGTASWYGKRYQGSKTSIGETYDVMKFTAAHPTLPLPCYVKVTNLENGRTLIVRVNDRGPFLGGKIIDLSYAAAIKLGFSQAGSARVQLDLIIL